MARHKSTVSTTSADEKISVEVEETTTKPVEDTTTKKQKTFGDEEKVKIKCLTLAGKKVMGKLSIIEFDDKGIATVKGIEAKRFLTIPGYSLA